MKQAVKKIIKATAEETARTVIQRQRCEYGINLYRAMERLLRSYKSLKHLVESANEYCQLPPERSRSVTTAIGGGGGGVRDRDDIIEEAMLARTASYERTRARFEELDAVIRQFENREEFIVIRMYYFGEDADGNDRGEAGALTFEAISAELAGKGVIRTEKTLRTWRTRLVQEMTVLLFGVDGAVSIEAGEPKRGQAERG